MDDNRRLKVLNVRVLENQVGTHDIQFDLEWRAAFRQGQHWNAAWVFLKVNPTETTATDSQQDVLAKLVDHTHADAPAAADIRARVQAEIHRLVQEPGFALPPLPPAVAARAGAIKRGLDDKASGIKQALDNGKQDFEEGLKRLEANLEEGHEVLGTTSEASAAIAAEAVRAALQSSDLPPPPPVGVAGGSRARRRAIRVQRHTVLQGNQQVEVDTDFAFLRQSDDGAHLLTSFTKWEHLPISTRRGAHVPTKDTVIVPSEDGMGVFIHLNRDARGQLRLQGLRVRSTRPRNDTPVKIWVGALEMVHIPAGDYHLGDPQGAQGPTSCFYTYGAESDDKSHVVRSEDTLAVGEQAGNMIWNNEGQMGEPADIPAHFPKAHRGYYVMKHQVTQGEYADFINHLKGHPITIRYPYGGQGDYRYTIYKTWNSVRACTRPERACNWLSWSDGIAYAWWAGLRPMTELEYEKACRGPKAPVPEEYAWGSTTLVQSLVILGDETDKPVVQGNAHIANTLQGFRGGDGGMGPVPDDAFQASAWRGGSEGLDLPFDTEETFTWREETGGSYYGVMGLTGNLWEYVVTVGMEEGRRFVGEHGNGQLNQEGLPDSPNTWPGPDNRGMGYRGGSWYTSTTTGRVADRRSASGLTGFTYRSHDTGIRCARTAPETD